MADLITNARARVALPSAAASGADDTSITTLVTACSKAIERYCKRVFASTAYDEIYNGNGQHRLMLKQFPVVSVQSVRYRQTIVLQATNTSASVQQARVSITSTGLSLIRVASGIATTNNLTFAGNVTLTAMATAITAVGNGWTGSVIGGY